MTRVPDPPQFMTALEEANRVRLARSEIKHQIFDGTLPVAWLIFHPPECILTMTVGQLFSCQRRWGAYRTAGFLTLLEIPEHTPVGELSLVQRREIVWGLSA